LKTAPIFLKWILIIVLTLGVGGWLYLSGTYARLTPDNVRDFILGFGAWAPGIFILIYIVLLFIPPLSVVGSTAGGLAFGPIQGLLLVLFAATVGSVLPMLLSRKFGRQWVETKTKGKRIGHLIEKANDNSFLFVLYMRLIPVLPFEVQNYVAGLSRIGVHKFMLATALGIAPISFSLALLGDTFSHGLMNGLKSHQFIIAVLVIALAIGLPIAIRYLIKKEKKPTKDV